MNTSFRSRSSSIVSCVHASVRPACKILKCFPTCFGFVSDPDTLSSLTAGVRANAFPDSSSVPDKFRSVHSVFFCAREQLGP